jgi:hypothetical protein
MKYTAWEYCRSLGHVVLLAIGLLVGCFLGVSQNTFAGEESSLKEIPGLVDAETLGASGTMKDQILCLYEKRSGELCLELRWIQGPHLKVRPPMKVNMTESQFSLRLATQEGPLAAKELPEVELWMPAHGHGAPQVLVAQSMSGGTPLVGQYVVTDVYFVMNGDWEIRVSLKVGDEAEPRKFIFKVSLAER